PPTCPRSSAWRGRCSRAGHRRRTTACNAASSWWTPRSWNCRTPPARTPTPSPSWPAICRRRSTPCSWPRSARNGNWPWPRGWRWPRARPRRWRSRSRPSPSPAGRDATGIIPHDHPPEPPMASSLLVLLDDIASVLDDVAAMTKVATRKTAGVLGDDLALNAEQVGGVRADRELPVVWAVAKGSLRNKAILVPSALAISTLLPWMVTPLLMLGGLYLCYEGFEKVWHKLFGRHADAAERAAHVAAVRDGNVDLLALEKRKIRGAIR